MGLDMYLEGRKHFWTKYDPENQRKEDDLRVSCVTVDLGYWRKHPNLHGFIVEAFAGGKDNCQDIELSAVDIRNIISAVKEDRLPHTEGFFFGASDGSEKEDDLRIFERALAWLEEANPERPKLDEGVPIGAGFTMHAVKVPAVMPRETRVIVYSASW